jgi:serine/threonine-protein phosphatase 2A regulatory subunit A
MVKRLVMWDNYTSKISGISLIPICFRNLPEEEHPGLKSVVLDLGKDDTPMVRRAVASILSELSEIYDEESFRSDIKPMLYLFLADDIDSVKMKSLEQIHILAKYIEQSERDTNLLSFMLKMDANKKNWRIRYHLPDCLAGVMDCLCRSLMTKLWTR